MAILDLTKPSQQAKVPAGTGIIKKNTPVNSLILLHQGEIAYQDGRTLFKLKDNCIPLFGNLVSGEPASISLVTSKDSLISIFPIKPSGPFQSLILGKLNVGMLGVRTIAQEIVQSYQAIRIFDNFSTKIQRTIDTFSLLYYRLQPSLFDSEQVDGGPAVDPILPAARVVVDLFKENNNELPHTITPAWLQADHGGLLQKSYEFDSSFDQNEFNFLRRLLGLPPNIQGAMFKADLEILKQIGLRLVEQLSICLKETSQVLYSIDEGMEYLFRSEHCFAEKFFLQADLFNSSIIDLPAEEMMAILQYIHGQLTEILEQYQKLSGRAYTNVVEAYQRLGEFIKNNDTFKNIVKEKQESISAKIGVDFDAIKQELKGSSSRILAFCDFPSEENQQLQVLLKELRAQKTPLDSTTELRKLKRPISQAYFKAYEKAFHKFKQSRGNVPRFIKLMLNYGFFDDQMLDPEHLVTLCTIEDNTRGKPEYPIFLATDWLEYIASGKEDPSVDEMGQSYFERLKLEHKEMGWKRETDIPPEINNFDNRVKEEMKHFVETNVKLTSGSPITAFPILTKFHIMQDLEKSLVTRDRLSEALDQLIDIDYSAFHREIILNDEERKIFKEFVQVQVFPNLIILPSIGNKIMMWQELAIARRKDSPGRLALPIFTTTDLYSMIIEAVGAFRWELLKSVLGPEWNDVSKSSLTSDYMDYVQFFKKNRELSEETKEKLAAEFKRFRDDRSKFVNDYSQWIRFESQGSIKLNRVVRGIFYRHIPFKKEIRDQVCTQPAFSEFHNRFTNIRRKKLNELENRWKKYGEKELLPEPLKETLRYFSV
ncbi:MAG: Crp/Fnr family transcriptional regulator [Leptonema sp. (in: Bacteria)]|nr:Crp/Fnr family transcriptional regulator [Leptonema sp. (in: bacteria)]